MQPIGYVRRAWSVPSSARSIAPIVRICAGIAAAASLIGGASREASAATYYVDAVRGSDVNAGTSPQTAWRSLQRANRTVLRPGDDLRLHGEQRFAAPLIIGSSDAGDPRRPVTITSYASGMATIVARATDGVTVDRTAGVRIERLAVVGSGSTTSNPGIGVHAFATGDGPRLDTLHFADLNISGFRSGGLQVEATGFGGFTNVKIERVTAHNNGDFGIDFVGRYVTRQEGNLPYSHTHVLVTDSTAYRNNGDPSTGQNTGSGILLGQVQDGVIRYCSAYANGGRGRNVGGGPVGIWAFDANRILIEHNVSYDNLSQPAGPSGMDGDGFDFDGGTSDSLMQYNYSRNNQGAGYLLTQFAGARPFTRNLLRFNVGEDDATGIGSYVDPGDVIQRTVFDNNTIYTTGGADTVQILPFGAYDGVAFHNNVLLNGGNGHVVNTQITRGIALQGNLYWAYGGRDFNVEWGSRTYRTLAAWRSASGVEVLDGHATGFDEDPRLNAPGRGGVIADPHRLAELTAYRLSRQSRIGRAGLDLQRLFGIPIGPTDFYGFAIPESAPPVGAASR